MGHPASPFIGEGKARVTEEKKEKDQREKASKVVESFFSFMWVPPIRLTSIGTAPCHGPIHHWRRAQAPSAGHGVPLRLDGCRGELTRLSASVRGLDRTTPARADTVLDVNS